MKKLLSIFVIALALLITFDSAVYAQNKVKFIYIHGTNDNNYKKKYKSIFNPITLMIFSPLFKLEYSFKCVPSSFQRFSVSL